MTDADALQRYARSADPDAFAELVRRYEQLVFSVCVRRLGCTSDADDAAQQTFMKLARAAAGVRGSLAAWLHTTATRTAIDLGRQATTRRRYEAEAARHRADDRAPRTTVAFGDAAGFDPAQRVAWKELSAALDEAVLDLPAAQRRLVVDVYFQGRTQREVAEATGKSQARVCRQLKDAVAALRGVLSKRGVLLPASALTVGLGVVQEAAAAPSPALSIEFTKVGLSGLGAPSATATAGPGAATLATGSSFGHPALWLLGALAASGVLIAAAAFFAGDAPKQASPPPPAVNAPADAP